MRAADPKAIRERQYQEQFTNMLDRVQAIASRRPMRQSDLRPFGDRVRKLRATMMSALELADAVGITEAQAMALEHGSGWFVTPELVAKIALELETDPGLLLG